MNGHGKSDRPVVPTKPPNKGEGAPSPAEGVEGRGLAKESLLRQNQSIGHRAAPDWPNELERIRQAAKKDHPYPEQRLRVRIQGKNPVRQLRSPGSVEGARGNPCPYSDQASEGGALLATQEEGTAARRAENPHGHTRGNPHGAGSASMHRPKLVNGAGCHPIRGHRGG